MGLQVRPLHDRILVRRLDEDDKTAGGLIIPDSAKKNTKEGRGCCHWNGRVTEDGKTFL